MIVMSGKALKLGFMFPVAHQAFITHEKLGHDPENPKGKNR